MRGCAAWMLAVLLVAAGCTASGAPPDGPPRTGSPSPGSPSQRSPSQGSPSQGSPSQGAVGSRGVPVGPDGVAFYAAPEPPTGARPGDVIWARALARAPAGSRGSVLLYWSTTVAGDLVAVSAVLYEPAGAPPASPRPIFAWAHGTSGLADACAPSRAYYPGWGVSDTIVTMAIQAGAAYVASDFQGLGTPGEHPYIVGQAAGRDVLDSIRAAARFTAGNAGRPPEAIVLGESQGGSAALLAAELQPTYAPDVRLLAAVAVSAPSELGTLVTQLSGTAYFGYVLMALHGFEVAYPELTRLNAALTPAGRVALGQIPAQCMDEILSTYAGATAAEFGVAAVLRASAFRAVLARNDPGGRTSVPILLLHGEADDTLPVRASRELVRRYCAAGTPVTAVFYPGLGHTEVLTAALTRIMNYVRDRRDGVAPATSCAAR